MNQRWLRNALAIVLGVVVAGSCVALVEVVGHRLADAVSAFFAAIGALFVGALVGGSVAVRIAGSARYGWVVAGALAALSLMNVLAFPHPSWFIPAAGAAVIAGGWLAARVSAKRPILP